MLRKRLLAVVLVVVILLVTVGGASAVTWGVPDNGEHPYVGTLLFQRSDGWYSCSGTLLDSMTVLTAAHCTYGNLRTYFMNAESVPARDKATESLEQWLANHWVQASSATPHSQYAPGQYPSTYDVGIVKLSAPINLGTYGALPTLNQLESLRGQERKANFTIVGYGMQGYINPFESDIWARYKGNLSLIELNSTFAAGMSAKFSNNPGKGSGGSGSCFGDSGGPIFYGNSNTVVAVVSWGITPCIGVDYQFRVDTQLARDFLSQFVALP